MPYDPVQTEVMNDRLVEVYSAEFLESLRGAGDPDPRRSSSSACRARARRCSSRSSPATASRGHERAALRRPPRDLAEPQPRGGRQLPGGGARAGARALRRARRASISSSRGCTAARGAPRFIDKMPNNFPNVGLIALILPNAKIIDARRHPLDACLSCYRQLFAKGQTFTYDLTEIGEYYLQYQRMMDHWAGCCRAGCSPCSTRRSSRTSRRRCGGCWSSAACPGRTPACASTRATGRCARRSRAGAPADLRPLSRPLAALRAPPRRADRRDRADPRALPALRAGLTRRGRRYAAGDGAWRQIVEDEVDAVRGALVHDAVDLLVVDLVGLADLRAGTAARRS